MQPSTPEIAEAKEYGNLNPQAVHVLRRNFGFLEANGVKLFVDDREDIVLPKGAQRVYPFTDEGAELLSTAQRVVSEDQGKFQRIIDCFAGGGNSMLPLLQATIAERGFGIDLNPRAVALAQSNATLNGLETKATFMMEDVNNLGEIVLSSEDRTLFIANPPFALTTQEEGKGEWDVDGLPGNAKETSLMREGGRDGLKLTRCFITQSLAKAYAERTMQYSKPGDAIIGVAYSRIGIDGRIELEEELKSIVGDRGTFTVELVEGAPLWRGPNGKKEQPNPMPLTSMNIKGTTDEERAKYDQAAANHLEEGYDRLGYYRYIIRIGKHEEILNETHEHVDAVMRTK